MTQRKRDLQREDGNALILVLVFIVTFGIIMASILNFSSTGVNTAQRIAEVRDVQHAADGAVEGAINSLRTAQLGPVGSSCATSDFSPQNATGDPKIVVKCTRQATSGSSGSTPDTPSWAILTTGTAAGEGFHASMTGNDYNLQVNGGIFSYGDLTVSGTRPRLSVVGRAVGKAVNGSASCDGARVFATVPVVCALTSPAANSADAASYNYPHQTLVLPTAAPTTPPSATAIKVDPIPTCAAPVSNTVVRFEPGLYTVLPKYLFTKSGCGGDVWWFQPGTYFFRFPDSDALWTLQDGTVKETVVGGTQTAAWNGNSTSSTVSTILASGGDACLRDALGVQFMFGGKSRIETPSNSYYLQLCAKDAPSGPTPQQIAIYGLRTADETSVTCPGGSPPPCNATLAPAAGSVTTTATLPSTATLTLGGLPAVVTLDKSKPTATIAVSRFAGIPEGSTIQSFSLQVAHVESDPGRLDESLQLTFPSGTASCNVADDGSCNLALANIGQGGLPAWRDIDQMTAAMTVTRPNTGAQTLVYTLNQLRLVVSYTPPRYERSTLTVSQFLVNASNSNPTIKLHGTLFAPDSAISVRMHNKGDSIFRRGVIARTIDARVVSSSTQNEAPFQLPGSAFSREVLLEAYVTDASVPSNLRLRARVRFIDNDDKGTPLDTSDDVGVPGHKVQIINWQVRRP